nr:type II secretion system protein GspK [Brevundimonas denitrificans]
MRPAGDGRHRHQCEHPDAGSGRAAGHDDRRAAFGLRRPARDRGAPPGGWSDTAAFWDQPALAGLTPSNAAYDQAGVFTRFFALDARVAHGGAEAVMSALIEAVPGGAVRTVARRWTTDE